MRDQRASDTAPIPPPFSSEPLPFTGERYVPEVAGNIEIEHRHRYHYALSYVEGKAVLDIASGEGYGSALLASKAASVIGVDVASDAVTHATQKYRLDNLEFRVGSCSDIPVPDGAVDVVVSFETIEHHGQHEEMLAEFKRVLKPGGLVVISSPDKAIYSDRPRYHNPFHVKELYRDEFEALFRARFKNVLSLGQKVIFGSGIVPSEGEIHATAVSVGLDDGAPRPGLVDPIYNLVLASDAALPSAPTSFLDVGVDASQFVQAWKAAAEQRAADLAGLASELTELRKEAAKLAEENTQKDSALASATAELMELRKEAAKLAEEKKQARDGCDTLETELKRHCEDQTRLLATLKRADYDGRLPKKLTGLKRWIPGRGRKIRQRAREYHRLAGSPLFDRDWYLANNPDIAARAMDPVYHYLRYGAAEGRAPGPHFSGHAYRQANPDVADSGENPLLHFLRIGAREGRLPGCGLIVAELHSPFDAAAYREWARLDDTLSDVGRRTRANTEDSQAALVGDKLPNSALSPRLRPSDPVVTPAEFLDAEPDVLDATVSVVIPTLNAGYEFPLLLKKLRSQIGLRKVEIIIVDSGSSDDTVKFASSEQCRVVSINKAEFSHSYARNRGAEVASGDYILFMVQDAYPIGDYWLARLVHGLRGAASQGLVALSCAEFPRADTELFYNAMIDIHYKFLGCADQDRIGQFHANDHVSLRQRGQLSDVACLISLDVFNRYKYHGRYAEDLLLGVQLIKDGYKVAMISNLRVVHSHNRPQGYYLRRSFVDVVFLVAAFPDHPIPPAQHLAGILTAATALGQHIAERKLRTGLDPDRFLSQLIGGLSELKLPSQAAPFASAISCDHSPFQRWLEHCESENGRPNLSLSTEERRTAITARDMFCDRLRALKGFARGIYPIADEFIARQFNEAIQKSLAMSLGAHLAFAYLRRLEMSEVDATRLEKLMPLMIEGI